MQTPRQWENFVKTFTLGSYRSKLKQTQLTMWFTSALTGLCRVGWYHKFFVKQEAVFSTTYYQPTPAP